MSFNQIKIELEKLDKDMNYTTRRLAESVNDPYNYSKLLIILARQYKTAKILLKLYSPLYFCFIYADMDEITDILTYTTAENIKQNVAC